MSQLRVTLRPRVKKYLFLIMLRMVVDSNQLVNHEILLHQLGYGYNQRLLTTNPQFSAIALKGLNSRRLASRLATSPRHLSGPLPHAPHLPLTGLSGYKSTNSRRAGELPLESKNHTRLWTPVYNTPPQEQR